MSNEEIISKTDITFDSEFIKFYSELKQKCTEDTVFMLFNHGTFYTLHNENAKYVSKHFLNTTESLKVIEVNNKQQTTITYTWISQTRFPTLIRHLLIENSFSVEVYSKTNPKSLTNKQWKLELEASPGCLGSFEHLLYEDDVNVSIQLSSVYVNGDNYVSVVSIDTIGCIIYLGQFQDNDCLRQLETILVRSNPKECLIEENVPKKFTQLLRRNHILARKYPSTSGNPDLEVGKILLDLSITKCQDLVKSFLKESSGQRILIPLKPLLSKQKLLLAKMNTVESSPTESITCEYPFGCFFVKELNPGKFVRLDLPSIQHLHLLPQHRDSKLKHSLFQFLNQCKTYCGMKLLETFIRQPCLDKKTIETRLDIVEFFIDNNELSIKIRERILPRIPDITKLYKKLNTGRHAIKDIFNLYLLLEQLRHLKSLFDDNKTENDIQEYPLAMKSGIIEKLSKSLAQTNGLYMKLVQALDLDHYATSGELTLNVKTFPNLAEVDSLMKQFTDKVHQEHRMLQSRYGEQIFLEQNKDIGWFYQASKKSIIVDKSIIYQIISSNQEKDLKFLTRLLNEINHEYCSLQKHFDKLSQNCIHLLLNECREDLFRIASLESFVSLLDVLLSFAKVACDSGLPFAKPTILPKGSDHIELIQFRHPILEMLKSGQFVPNQIKFDRACKFFIITGPNMGGKSTLLRSVALCVLMAQIGSYIPCESATISLVDAIYTRISSNDDQSIGLSTFMAEMYEIAGILKSTTPDSLILIDELGRSTATNDGFGIAQSVTEYISNEIRAYTLFATHFHNLGSSLSNIQRLHMQSSFNEDQQLVIHYKALLEPLDSSKDLSQSFGIEVMKCVGMPEYLVEAAQNRLASIYNSTIDAQTFNRSMLMESMMDLDTIENIDAFIKKVDDLV